MRSNACESEAADSVPGHHRAARALAYVTVVYNILEGVVSIVFARLAGSTALLGFGVDSFVESLSGLVMVWRFGRGERCGSEDAERRERIAVRLVAVSLVVLACYVAYEACEKLYKGEGPQRSVAGLVIAAVSLVAMPILYVAKRRMAAAIHSHSLAADAKQTLACLMLSVALLVGSGLNYWLGLWQADPLAGLLIAGFLVREGVKAWSAGELCCC